MDLIVESPGCYGFTPFFKGERGWQNPMWDFRGLLFASLGFLGLF
jgi:hypothetical protein